MSCHDFEFNDAVTSDVSFVARGDSLEAVFAAASEALLASTLENPRSVGIRVRRSVALAEPDLALLLLGFLNELIFLRDAEDLLLRPRELSVSSSPEEGARLEVELAGESIDRSRHQLIGEVKAATAHGLEVEPDGRGWRATVTLDV
jgi:SHS2 domain-containing protein